MCISKHHKVSLYFFNVLIQYLWIVLTSPLSLWNWCLSLFKSTTSTNIRIIFFKEWYRFITRKCILHRITCLLEEHHVEDTSSFSPPPYPSSPSPSPLLPPRPHPPSPGQEPRTDHQGKHPGLDEALEDAVAGVDGGEQAGDEAEDGADIDSDDRPVGNHGVGGHLLHTHPLPPRPASHGVSRRRGSWRLLVSCCPGSKRNCGGRWWSKGWGDKTDRHFR